MRGTCLELGRRLSGEEDVLTVLAEDLSWASNHLQHRLQDIQLRLPGLHRNRNLNSRMRMRAPVHFLRNNANLFKMPVRKTDHGRLFKSFCLGGNRRKFINKQHYWKCFLFCPSADRKAFIPLKSWPKWERWSISQKRDFLFYSGHSSPEFSSCSAFEICGMISIYHIQKSQKWRIEAFLQKGLSYKTLSHMVLYQ